MAILLLVIFGVSVAAFLILLGVIAEQRRLIMDLSRLADRRLRLINAEGEALMEADKRMRALRRQDSWMN